MKTCVTVSEAARIKKVTRQAIYLAIRLNRLRAYKHDNHYQIFLADLNDYDSKRFSRIYHSVHEGEPIFDEGKGYFSVDKASKMIEVDKQKLYYAIRKGDLKAERKRSSYVIHVNDLFRYQKTLKKKNFTERYA